MSSILDRVLNKAAAPSNDNAPSSRSGQRETRASVKNIGSGKQAEPSGDDSVQPQPPPSTNNNSVDTADNNANNKTSNRTTTTTKSATAAASTVASRSRKSPSTVPTSIAERLPKGSRTKPLPPKSTTPTSPSIPASVYSSEHQQTQTGDKLSQAISLSSTLPSLPSQVELIDLDEEGDERMPEKETIYLSLASEDDRIQPTSTTTDNKPNQHQYSTKAETKAETKALPTGDEASDHQDGQATAGTAHGIDPKKKQPSAILIASSKDDFASIIPSVQVERIANWMGGVKEAMEEDVTIEPDTTTQPGQQQLNTAVNNTAAASEKPPPVKAEETLEETPATTGPRKPALRRPPPAILRHAVPPVNASPPLSPQAQSISEVVPSSLSEDEPLQRNYRTTRSTATAIQESVSKGKRVFVENSLASLPPVPLFHEEASNVSESDGHRRRSGGEPSGQGSRAGSGVGPRSHYDNNYDNNDPQDDLSTIVGQKLTQDSFVAAPLQSLSSFVYETEEEVKAKFTSSEMEHVQGEPSLPSELTASCLQELGLKRKNVRDRRGYGAGKRQTRAGRGEYGVRGSNIDGDLEEVDEDGDDDEEGEDDSGGVALAQRVAFPSSFDLAPVSTLSKSLTPPLSLEVIEGPAATYTPAGRTAARENKENEAPPTGSGSGSGSGLQGMEDPDLSFPSPPASLVFSTMPSMPTFPTFPSALYQEPSLIILDSQTQTQDVDELSD
ncbi:hypothetical protein BGX23_011518 [Mortierella sp. AD031]|nr:hypothetical protein BGX23_011518 [Mortierella sp. AD031]KAG0219289.1 hypothetical protein BGX33_003836 [Mortierella sp. NVP41]